MRFAFRFLIPLLLLLALIAWGASAVATRSAKAWADRDLRARARLVLASSRDTLTRGIAAGDRIKSQALLDALLRDERLIAAAVCDRSLHTLAAAGLLPSQARCEERGEPEATLALGLDENVGMAGGDVHVSWLPVGDGITVIGYLVLVHDLSFVDRRASATRRALFIAFGLVGFAAAVATLLTTRLARRSCTAATARRRSPIKTSARCSPTSASWWRRWRARSRPTAASGPRRGCAGCWRRTSAVRGSSRWPTGSPTCTCGERTA
jgi:trehalose 6-phosphate synthase